MSVRLYNQWPAVFGANGYNWVDFTFIKVFAEAGIYKGRYVEVVIGLMGLTVELVYRRPVREEKP